MNCFQLEELKNILDTMNGHQTSICKGIPEEKLITWANRKNISQILIERFASKIVFRDRNCNIVMMDTDQVWQCNFWDWMNGVVKGAEIFLYTFLSVHT